MRTHFRHIGCGSSPSTGGADTGQGALGFFSRYLGGGRSPRTSPCAAPRISERGSALLIVLGFLSFMMISAVSFAVYMRIERQASSNYRHATTARHLLNAGLSRAINDVDLELIADPLKFPDWPGRVMASGGSTNGTTARVLSLESLSFIPGILVNDVRWYALSTTDGAKWEAISMGGGQGEIGRYAYVCVNLSDMLNVNLCKAAFRDSATNRVSIGHLFPKNTPNSDLTAFDTYVKTTDLYYETLQDFYACMDAKNDLAFGSPYHEYIRTGDDVGFDEAVQHILVTDSIVKPEPVTANPANPTPLNIADKAYQNDLAAAVDAFATQLAQVTDLKITGAKEHFECLLMDYLDKDSKPYWRSGLGAGALYRPSAEMVPMVSQFILPSALNLVPQVLHEPVGSGERVKLRLAAPGQLPLLIQSMYPFKYWKERQNKDGTAFNFTMDARAYLVAVKVPAGGSIKTQNPGVKNLVAPLAFPLPVSSVVGSPMPAAENTVLKVVPVIFDIPACEVELYEKDSHGVVTWKNGFAANDQVRIALVVFAAVKQGSTLVDLVPGFWSPASKAPDDLDAAIVMDPGIYDRLFFQSSPLVINDSMGVPAGFKYEWSSLEVADPRFNHKASNWVIGQRLVEENDVKNTLANQIVTEAGRDGDVHISVSNMERLYSPGEFGFLVRPYPDASAPPRDVELLLNDDVKKAEDYAHMYRTVRLYDHGPGALRDQVYEAFNTLNPDGTLPGARVNPLSDIPQVLAAAIDRTPLDYWYAAQTDLLPGVKNTFNETLGAGDWAKFTNAWTRCLINARTPALNTSIKPPYTHLSNEYGKNTFGWYWEDDPMKNFLGGTALSEPLHEIDRKMLYSFSLESFCDRQQLFLYVLRAEATVPTIGGGTDSGVKSLAGGRAVALVWRDPYPATASTAPNYHPHRILYFKQLDK